MYTVAVDSPRECVERGDCICFAISAKSIENLCPEYNCQETKQKSPNVQYTVCINSVMVFK